MIWSSLWMSSPSQLHRLVTLHFDERYKHKQNESFWASQSTPFGSQGTELWEPNIYIWVFFFESSIKFLQVTKTFASCSLFMYSFTHTNILSFQAPSYWNCHLQKRLILDEVFQWWYLFIFSGAGFANISPTFLISCKVQTRYSRILNYSEQYIGEHLSGTKEKIWIGSKYDAVSNFSCIALCNITKTFTFFCMSFLS